MIQKQKAAWKEATWIFLLSRLVIVLVSYLSVAFLPMHHLISPVNYVALKRCNTTPNCFLLAWWHSDAVHYVEVAYVGYAHHMPLSVFFPIFPLLVRGLGTLFGGSIIADYAAGIIIANICFYGVLALFYQLLYQDFGHSVARYALIYLAFAPYGLFFFAGYTESPFLLLSLAVFFFLRRGQVLDWWLAGLCGCVAALTRATGIVLLVPFLVLFVQRFGVPFVQRFGVPFVQRFGLRTGVINLASSNSDKSLEIQTKGRARDFFAQRRWPTVSGRDKSGPYHTGNELPMQKNELYPTKRCIFNAILAMALVPAGLLIYMLYLWITFGNPLIFHVEEAAIWQRYTAFPWVGTFDAIRAIVGFDRHFYSRDVADFTFTFVPLATLVAGWKRLPLHYSLFSAAMVLFVLCQPCQFEGLMSVPRYLLVIFPIILIFALWSKHNRLTWQLIIPFILFFVLNVIQFAIGNWVA